MGPRAASTPPTSAKSSHWRHPCRSLTCRSRKRLRSEGARRRLRPLRSLGLQTGKQLLRAETGHVEAGVGSIAVANGKIDVLTREVDVLHGRADPQIDLGMGLGETAQPMDEPLRRKIRRRAHGERAATLALQQALGSVADAVERIAHDHEISAACLSDHQPLPFAIEQLQPELGLECLHLMADRALGHAEFLGGAREALVAGRGFKSLERIERRQAARHGRTKS